MVYPPVDTAFFHPSAVDPGSHVLVVSALVPYKRIDLAIEACQRLGLPLRIVGDRARSAPALERQAGGSATFLGWLSDEAIRDEYRQARAVLLPGEEDFGIVPVEAQACGRPVVALGPGRRARDRGGRPHRGALRHAVSREPHGGARARDGDAGSTRSRIRQHAERFSRATYDAFMSTVLDETLAAPAGARW